METFKWYVVEVSFNPNNPIHRAIAEARGDDIVELHGSYEEVMTRHVGKLAFFRVVSEITDMSGSFPNQWKLPEKVGV